MFMMVVRNYDNAYESLCIWTTKCSLRYQIKYRTLAPLPPISAKDWSRCNPQIPWSTCSKYGVFRSDFYDGLNSVGTTVCFQGAQRHQKLLPFIHGSARDWVWCKPISVLWRTSSTRMPGAFHSRSCDRMNWMWTTKYYLTHKCLGPFIRNHTRDWPTCKPQGIARRISDAWKSDTYCSHICEILNWMWETKY